MDMAKHKNNFKVWMVRAGRGSWLIDSFLNNNIIAIGWNDLGKIDSNTTYEQLKEKLATTYTDWSSGTLNQSAGQIWRFYNEFNVEDRVITYDSNSRRYYTGVIKSEYDFDDNYEYNHFRKVEWKDYPIERDALKVDSKNTLGSILTIFEISKNIWDELEELNPAYVSEENIKEVERVQELFEKQELEQLKEDAEFRSIEFIKDILVDLNWDEMERLVAGLMRAMGYKTRMTKKGADLGSDIIASPDGLAMVEPIIKVEVKHKVKSKEKISAPDLRNFIGGLRTSTRGIYVSSTGFTKDAEYEAQRANFQITLINLETLVELIVEYYENLDPETKSLVPLKKIYWPI